MDRRFLIILSVLAILFVGIFVINKPKTKAPGTNSSKVSSNLQGSTSKGVTLVEYGDFQCPACAQYYPLIKQLKTTYANDVSFRFANFPLVQIHPNAMAGARAGQAAALQGKFWEMHDLLYENQTAWSSGSNPTPFFNQYAKQIGLDTAKFTTDMAKASTLETINADVAEAQSFGADSTPTFVLNGKKLSPNPNTLEGFTKLIDQAIKDAAKK